MIVDRQLAICAVISIAGHFAFARGLDHLPRRDDRSSPPIVQVHVIEPPAPAPEPEPPKEPEPVKPEPPKPQVHERPRPHAAEVKRDVPPVDTPPVDHPPTTTDTTTTPVFGVTMESTSQAGNGPAMPVGNTTHPAPTSPGNAAAVKPLAEPVAAVEVTKMPMPIGGCTGLGKYTAEALAAAVEGVVVLDIVVDERGRARDITVVQGLPHGLTQASIAALNACKFTPGEKDGKPVPVRVRGYKVRFILPDGR